MDNKISPYDSLIGNELIKNYMGVVTSYTGSRDGEGVSRQAILYQM